MKFGGTEATGGQARFWSLLGELLLHILGDCHKCLGKAERDWWHQQGRASLSVWPVTSGLQDTFLAVAVTS